MSASSTELSTYWSQVTDSDSRLMVHVSLSSLEIGSVGTCQINYNSEEAASLLTGFSAIHICLMWTGKLIFIEQVNPLIWLPQQFPPKIILASFCDCYDLL